MFWFIAGLIIFLLLLRQAPDTEIGDELNTPTMTKKQCPPHEWEEQILKDHTGEIQGTRLVCRICGPYSKLMGHGEV